MIRVPEVRLVGDHLEEISEIAGTIIEPGVYTTRQAQSWAQQLELDLVEISPKAVPPVCKIVDYRKFIYDKKKKEKEMKAKIVKTVMKEIRFGPNTDEHDFEFKLRHAKKISGGRLQSACLCSLSRTNDRLQRSWRTPVVEVPE